MIGVNSQIKSGSDSNSGVGFAVPVSTVKFVVPQIKNGGKVERAYLGVRNGDTPDRSGAVVGTVVPGGPAAQAGLQPGDKITEIDDSKITVLRGRLRRGYGTQARGTGQSDGRARRQPAYPDCGSRNASRHTGGRMTYGINDPRRPDVTPEDRRLHALDRPEEPNPSRAAHDALENALFEIKRVIVGQEAMLERVLVALLAGGHVLLEGVPGLAKTLTVKTVADVLGGSFKRLQFTPDLVPADLVGTRIYRPDTGAFDIELGPVFCNFLLADEINRAPAKVQSRAARGDAGAPGHDRPRDAPRPRAVPRARDAEPDRVRGHLPAARGPGRPLHVQARRRLPVAPRRGLRRRALAGDRRSAPARSSRPSSSPTTSARPARSTSTGA